MIILRDKNRIFLEPYLPKESLNGSDLGELLLSIDALVVDKGLIRNQQVMNDFGEKVQIIYDRVYETNIKLT